MYLQKEAFRRRKIFFCYFLYFLFCLSSFSYTLPPFKKRKRVHEKKCFIVRDESQKRRRTKKNNNKKLWLREALAFATGVTEMLSVMIHSTVNWYN